MTCSTRRITIPCLPIIAFVAPHAIRAYGLQPASPELVGQLTKGSRLRHSKPLAEQARCLASPRAGDDNGAHSPEPVCQRTSFFSSVRGSVCC